jgi:small subunit ribosomal protein S6
MPANVYECLFMLDTSKVAGDVPAAVEQLHGILQKHKAEILASRPWDERRLAYPIGNQKKALYYLVYFKADANQIVGLENDFRLNELILRQMILRIEEKLVDAMLAVARDPHALALQSVVEPPSDDFSDFGGRGGGHGGPRGAAAPVGAGAGAGAAGPAEKE